MKNVTELLNAIDSGTDGATAQLLPLVYDELRSMAARKMAAEKPGATLQATALVHEAYMRLVGPGDGPEWNHRGHFFASAAEAMRRILVEAARSKLRKKRGGNNEREELADSMILAPVKSDRLLALDEAMDLLEDVSPEAAQLVKLRYFVGFTNAEAAEVMNISPRKGNDLWAYARVWLASKLGED